MKTETEVERLKSGPNLGLCTLSPERSADMLETLRPLLSPPQPKALDDVLAESFCPQIAQRSAEQVSDFCSCFLFLNVQSNSKQFIFYPATLAPEVTCFFFL